MSQFESIDPMTGQLIRTYEPDPSNMLKDKLRFSGEAFNRWSRMSLKERADTIGALSPLLLKRKSTYALLITREMGKSYRESVAEVEKCAWLCEYYAENARSILADKRLRTEHKTILTYRPLGTILGIMPWNFPFWQVIRFAIPVMVGGNTALLKHANNVGGCATELQKLFEDAGFPKGAFQSLFIDHKQTAGLIRSAHVQGVSLTGSTRAGKQVAAAAGKAVKPCVLELGGSDPYILLKDADLDKAVECCVRGRTLNAGQSCIGAKRFIVAEEIYNVFLSRFISAMSDIRFGDPMKEATDMGPLARASFRDNLHEQVTRSIEGGAECILGGEVPKRQGAFYPATILVNIKKGTPAYSEELFGPVASVFRASSVEDAVNIANDTPFGLGGAIFTRDISLAEKIAKEGIHSGSVAINNYLRSDPRVPFGGIKESGFGREMGEIGAHAFLNIKSISVY